MMMGSFEEWLAAEHQPITGVLDADHRVVLWYEEDAYDEVGEELLSLDYWQVSAIWEGLRLFEEVAKARLDAAANSGQKDLRQHNRVIESTVMAKRKISSIRRYMASKHQRIDPASIRGQVIDTAVGADNEGTTRED